MLKGYKVCPNCGNKFWAWFSTNRKFCSRKCRLNYYNAIYRHRRFMQDPAFKEKSLQRLLAWKERKKQEKTKQRAGNEIPPTATVGDWLGGETMS